MRNIDPALVTLLDTVRKTYESIPERFNQDLSAQRMMILTRVVSRLVSDVIPCDGFSEKGIPWSWLIVPDRFDEYVIDLRPHNIYPGPVLIRLKAPHVDIVHYTQSGPMLWAPEDPRLKEVAEIVDATEGARRFLALP
jgi:hypothetical protein